MDPNECLGITMTQYCHTHTSYFHENRYDVRVPSPMAHLVALHGCRILANMACDDHNRAEVARGSIGAVVHVAKLMADDPVLVCAVSAAVYNFVSRQETTHQVVVEAGTAEALEGMLKNLEYTDRKEKELVTRALTALEPDGWRGVDHGDEDIPEHVDESSTSVDDSSGMGLTIASNNAGGEGTVLAMISPADG
ncbi:unnamed protein product [Ectocarpus sp. 12 AP-2014]